MSFAKRPRTAARHVDLIAREQDRPLRQPLPQEVAVPVVSIAELELGVLVARDADAQLAARSLAAGRRPRVDDTWIAAAALVAEAEVWTQDADFSDVGGVVAVVCL